MIITLAGQYYNWMAPGKNHVTAISTYLKISVEMAVTWFLPGAIQL